MLTSPLPRGLLYFFGWQTLLLAQTIPHFIGCAIGTYLFYAQHNFPGVSFEEKSGWTYEKAALESSSYMVTGPVMGWFTANIGYHHVHHLNSRIPFYRLPEALRGIPELQRAKTTSLHPGNIYRCLRLKVWDVETQRMISLSEIRLSPAPSVGASDSRCEPQLIFLCPLPQRRSPNTFAASSSATATS